MHFQNLIIETDSQEAVRDIYKADGDQGETMQHIQGIQILFAPRTGNQVANKLSRMTCDSIQMQVWDNDPPASIVELLHFDCNPPP